MKRTILMIAGALAIAANAQADNPQVVIHTTYAEEDARAAAEFEANEKQTFQSLYHRMANTPHKNKVSQMYAEWVKIEQLKNHRQSAPSIPLTEGDPIPLSNSYDDSATIRIYLHDSGYTDLSDAQIAQVRSYMLAHGIRHVSELGQ